MKASDHNKNDILKEVLIVLTSVLLGSLLLAAALYAYATSCTIKDGELPVPVDISSTGVILTEN